MFLAGAVVVLGGLSLTPLYEDPMFACTANGALHAGTLILSLRGAASLRRKLLFVAITAALSIMSLYIGVIALVALAVLPDSERLPAVVAIAAMTGAITYGSLVRIFWLRGVKPRAILGVATMCAVTTVAGYILKSKFELSGMWWLAVIWWLTFSIGFVSMRAPQAQRSA